MEEGNALLVVTNNKPAQTADKFWILFKGGYTIGEKRAVLADSVAYKDGLVLLNGVTAIESVRPTVRFMNVLQVSEDRRMRVHKGVRYPKAVGVNWAYGSRVIEEAIAYYGQTYTSIVVERNVMDRIEGIKSDSLTHLELPWMRTYEEALEIANKGRERSNCEIRRLNSDKRKQAEELRRQIRGMEQWAAKSWLYRVFNSPASIIEKTKASPEDREWVMTEVNSFKEEVEFED